MGKCMFRLLGKTWLAAVFSLTSSKSYLVSIGWFRSYQSKLAVTGQDEPIPWMSYAFIDFITPRLRPEFVVLEYGSGNSSLFFAKRVANVVSVEHDRTWFAYMCERVPDNVEIVYRALEVKDQYVQDCLNRGQVFDLAIIDGKERVACIKQLLASAALSQQGVIVVDDAEREEYLEAYDLLAAKGFRRIDFSGIGPIVSVKKTTSLFYRNENVLGI